jgi:hypothetical protein
MHEWPQCSNNSKTYRGHWSKEKHDHHLPYTKIHLLAIEQYLVHHVPLPNLRKTLLFPACIMILELHAKWTLDLNDFRQE